MKLELKTLLAFVFVMAIVFAVVRPSLWKLNASHDIDSGIRLGVRSNGYPVIHALGYFDNAARVLVLHRLTSSENDRGEFHFRGSGCPDWLDVRSFGPGRIFDCVVGGRRVVIDDSVQLFFATDGERPRYVRLDYADYASLENVGFLETNEKMWRLCEQHSNRAAHLKTQ